MPLTLVRVSVALNSFGDNSSDANEQIASEADFLTLSAVS
jgi:hypothetical protein